MISSLEQEYSWLVDQEWFDARTQNSIEFAIWKGDNFITDAKEVLAGECNTLDFGKDEVSSWKQEIDKWTKELQTLLMAKISDMTR